MTEQLVRALIAGRKSNKVSGAKDGHGISLDAQDEDAREFCERHGWEVAGAAQDIISGTVAPMKRKDLGRWLTDPARLHSFDVIVFAHIDRISRGTDGDFSDIESWAHTNGKKLVMADSNGGIMFPSRNDQDFWMWTATKRQAGQEWQRIRARIWSARKNITSQGGIMGRAGWGYQIAGDHLMPSANTSMA